MSHSPEKSICPNCGFQTTHNYCAQCGQETHLHNETFWGMVMHFVGHYFHYDSKFWKTLKALIVNPGRLTIAYWNKQRMRYIPPISLYIFVSAVFFLVMLINPNKFIVGDKGEIRFGEKRTPAQDSALMLKHAKEISSTEKSWHEYDEKRDTANFMHFLAVQGEKIDEKTDGHLGDYMAERIYHTIPKVFFFLIPLMAFFLRLLFIKRKEVYFAAHSIFSLHIHSFIFIAFLLQYIPFAKDIPYLFNWLMGATLIYTIIALHNAYKTTWAKAIFYSIFLAIAYSLFLVVAIAVDVLVIFALA